MMADVLLVVHFLIVAFIVGGLLLVWIGAALGWRWVRNPWFRYLHLGAIAFVAAEALFGVMCPLTVWEDTLRGGVRPNHSSAAGCATSCTTKRRNGSSPPFTSLGRSPRLPRSALCVSGIPRLAQPPWGKFTAVIPACRGQPP